MQTALSTINELPSGKLEVANFKRKLKSEILAGKTDPLKAFVQLKYIEQTVTETLKDEEIEDHFLNEFMLYEKEKVVEVMGAKLQTQDVGVKYDYEASGDPEWIDLDKQIKELSEKKKAREKFLQNVPYDKGIVHPDTGLFITRPPRSAKTKVVCKLY